MDRRTKKSGTTSAEKKQPASPASSKLKQMKISAFCVKNDNGNRLNDDDVEILSVSALGSPDVISATPEKPARSVSWINRGEKVLESAKSLIENTPPLSQNTPKKPKRGDDVLKEISENKNDVARREDTGVRNVDDVQITVKSRPSRFDEKNVDGEPSRKKRLRDETDTCADGKRLARKRRSCCVPDVNVKDDRLTASEDTETSRLTNEIQFEDCDFEDELLNLKNLSQSELGFETPVICVVTGIAESKTEKILTVKSNGGQKGSCKLREIWTYAVINVNDLVTIRGIDTVDGWIVNSKNGYVSLYPNILTIPTSLVNALYCRRRAVLSNYYKSLEPSNKIMVVGNLVHEMLQKSLKIKSCSEDDINRIMEEILKVPENLKEILVCGLTVDAARLELSSFVPKIKNFVDVYVTREALPTGKNFKGCITEIVDIEEDVIAPKLGLKGRIDVTVKVDGNKILPLELKTGRASFSNEHRSQVALYAMMLQELGRSTESGLLLYLKDGIVEEIKPSRVEQRDLILLRNQYVRFLKSFKTAELPEPIRSEFGCSRCEYLTICTSYLRHDGLDKLSPNHPMRSITMPDLSRGHLDYFIRWSKLLCMENVDEEIARFVGILDGNVVPFRNEFKHVFKCEDGDATGFQSGDFVAVTNSNQRSTGKIINVTRTNVTALLDKKLDGAAKHSISKFQANMLNKYLTNLGCLMGDRFKKLREIVIDCKEPTFCAKLEKKILNEDCIRVLRDLNKEQQKAILKIITANDYVVVRGPPGTGKTQTIVALVKILAILNQTILITSHTHSSVDNILLRLDESVDFLRLGSLKSINAKLHPKSYANLINGCKTLEDVKNLYDRKIVAATCLGVGDDLIARKTFDYCLIDECSQVLQPEALKPLFCSRKFVLIGDSNQLPPIVKNKEAKKLKMDESLFERLENDANTISLRFQYRMNKIITNLANLITYRGGLECGNEEVANGVLKIRPTSQPSWIRDVLSNSIDKSVVFVDTSRIVKDDGESCSSLTEAKVVVKLVESLIDCGINQESVGIIAPYRDQVQLLISKMADKDLNHVEINTVDQYQGRDKKAIIYSCTKENQSGKLVEEFEILNDKRRLTVAVTRAKHKLIVVGDRNTVVAYKPIETLIENLNFDQVYQLRNGIDDFDLNEL